MQKNIAFYISDHNMEHAIRTIPILQNILKIAEELMIHVKSGREQIDLIRNSIKASDHLYFYEMDMRDRDIDCWDEMAEEEAGFLKERKIGLIVSDICPWIFLAADELRVKSLLLGNYTWAELCETEEEKEEYLSCYEQASHIYIYDLHSPELTGYGVEYDLVSMISCPYNMEEIESVNERLGRPLVFADVPMTGSIDVSEVPYHFVVTKGTPLQGANVTVLSGDIENLQDYVAASSYVIAYGSWNRMGEALLANRKSAFLVKDDIPMSRQMIDILKQREQCIEAAEEDLTQIELLLNKLKEFAYSFEYDYYNSDYDLAKKILFAYPEKRRRNRS
ncbi:MAG: hypothetical protein IJC41_03380 [Firmicutes bacterium]|nr:hypothetical protein [Bacillota bacterium]